MVEESGRELAAEIATDVLIIEDETFIAMDIEALVESLGHKVIGVARTHAEALALAKKKRPGLILADIQLADGSSGLDAVNELLGSFEAPVIFITAFPERFLTGRRPEPAFLIAKPFPARRGVGGGQPGAVLWPQGAQPRTAAGRAASEPVICNRFRNCLLARLVLAEAGPNFLLRRSLHSRIDGNSVVNLRGISGTYQPADTVIRVTAA